MCAESFVDVSNGQFAAIIAAGTSQEIEEVLYSNPEILECAVIAKQDPKWGEIPKAIVVLQPGSKLTEQDIVNFTRERMASFQDAERSRNCPGAAQRRHRQDTEVRASQDLRQVDRRRACSR